MADSLPPVGRRAASGATMIPVFESIAGSDELRVHVGQLLNQCAHASGTWACDFLRRGHALLQPSLIRHFCRLLLLILLLVFLDARHVGSLSLTRRLLQT